MTAPTLTPNGAPPASWTVAQCEAEHGTADELRAKIVKHLASMPEIEAAPAARCGDAVVLRGGPRTIPGPREHRDLPVVIDDPWQPICPVCGELGPLTDDPAVARDWRVLHGARSVAMLDGFEPVCIDCKCAAGHLPECGHADA